MARVRRERAVAVVLTGLALSCSSADPSAAPTTPTVTVPEVSDAVVQQCEAAQKQLFDLAIRLESIDKQIASATSYEQMATLARANDWYGELSQIRDEAFHVNAEDWTGLRFGAFLVEESAVELERGVTAVLQAQPPAYQPAEETSFDFKRGETFEGQAGDELGRVDCYSPGGVKTS